VAPAAPRPPASGGTAYLTASSHDVVLDPALDQNYLILYATCANLVTYPDKPAPAGSHIVPEVAEAVPTPTAGGTTYTFRIRTGFRFSPPSNAPVTAATFKSTIERFVNPHLKAQFASSFSDIVGYEPYVKGNAHGLSGVVARGNTLTIRLTHPDGGFLANLAVAGACAVPPGTPAVPLDHVPSAGPYYIASYTPRRQLILRRNPNYHGDRPHRLDEFVYTIGVDPSRAVTEIEAGKADYASDGIPSAAAPKLEAEYGPGSKAAKAGHQQYFANAANSARLLYMNASRPLFASARLRRAVNYAIDREALVAQERRFSVSLFDGGGEPIGDYIPPSSAGARDFHLYPLRPDLKMAKRLAGHVHATAILYAASQPPWPQEAAIIGRDLRALGIAVEVKEFPVVEFFQLIGRRGAPWDLAVAGWALGSTDPADWLNLFDSSTIVANNNNDLSYLDDPAYARKLHSIERLSGSKRYLAFSRLAYQLERDEAPAAAIATGTSQDFFSARIGCQLYQPVYGIDLGALCLRRPKA
jgi:peptide/nickel transport system substrate-binding protein